ncbi:MAG: antibiotic biosynthesis monooxygenase [Dehalococcoidia bacterium]|nr:antibiotic biosynthesis monooxygenase [Dehalococcoidia bacterium]
MTYIRLSIAKPRHGEEKRVEDIQGQIAEYVRSLPGCRESYLLHPHDDSGEIARISIYDSEESADQAANQPHLLSLRSELNLAAEAGHIERGFHAQAEYS